MTTPPVTRGRGPRVEAGLAWLSDAVRGPTLWPLVAVAVGTVGAVAGGLGVVGSRGALVVLTGLLASGAGCVRLVLAADRRAKLAALHVLAVSGAVAAAPDLSDLVMLIPVVAVGQVTVLDGWRRSARLTLIVCLVLVAIHLLVGLPDQNVPRFATLPLLGFVAGLIGRQQRRRVEDAEALVAETRRANQEQARAAALAERARLAREIHDVLAHSLGALTAQLGAADSLLDREPEDGGPHPALRHVRQARRLAAEGLQETRRGIAALREEPLPLPELLQSLAETYQSDQQAPARVTVVGAARPLPADVALAMYRTGQEALSNIRKYAPCAPVRIAVEYRPESAVLTVLNGPPTRSDPIRPGRENGAGFGLIGMRERAALLGGTLVAGPSPDGWSVALELPMGQRP